VQYSGTMRSRSVQLSLFEELLGEYPDLSEQLAVTTLGDRLVRQAHLRPPIDPRVLASMRGIAQISVGSQPQAGYLYPLGNGRFAVRLRAQDSPTRQRFTLFHEIAHTLLPGFGNTTEYRCTENSTEPKEKRTNAVAAALLFPRRFFEGDLAWAGLTTSGLEFLARRYQASLEATAIQAVDSTTTGAMCVVEKSPRLPHRYRAGASNLLDGYTHTNHRWPNDAAVQVVLDSDALERARTAPAPVQETTYVRAIDGTQWQEISVYAKSYPYTANGRRHDRVIALASCATEESPC